MEKRYYCSEDNKVYTESEMIKLFSELMLSDNSYKDSSFNDYMRDCLSKNGSLYEIKQINDDDIATMYDAAHELQKAVKKFCSAMSNVDEISFNNCLAKNYPFAYSLEEMPWEIESFYDDVYSALNNRYLYKIIR